MSSSMLQNADGITKQESMTLATYGTQEDAQTVHAWKFVMAHV